MRKHFLCGSVILLFSVFLMGSDNTEYKGNYNIWFGVVISSIGVTTTGTGNIVANTTSVISSTTYTDKTDWRIKNDANGYDMWIASYSRINTSDLNNNKIYPGETESPGGRLTDAIYCRTLAGSSNLTTCWILITGKDTNK